MDSNQDANPYRPPAPVSPRLGFVRTFQVGKQETHTVFIEASFWTGLRSYAVDAEGTAGPVHRGAAQFEVGKQERHEIRIEVDRSAKVNVYIDGELVQRLLEV